VPSKRTKYERVKSGSKAGKSKRRELVFLFDDGEFTIN